MNYSNKCRKLKVTYYVTVVLLLSGESLGHVSLELVAYSHSHCIPLPRTNCSDQKLSPHDRDYDFTKGDHTHLLASLVNPRDPGGLVVLHSIKEAHKQLGSDPLAGSHFHITFASPHRIQDWLGHILNCKSRYVHRSINIQHSVNIFGRNVGYSHSITYLSSGRIHRHCVLTDNGCS